MSSNRLYIVYIDGTTESISRCRFIKVEEGVLKFQVEDNSYDSHAEGRPLINIKSYRVEGV